MAKKSTVFISYRRKDGKDLATLISEKLKQMGADVFLDVRSIMVGDQFESVIEREIIDREYFLIILTPITLDSEWVRKEVQIAFKHGKKIIPITTEEFSYEVHLHDDVRDLASISSVEYDHFYSNSMFEILRNRLNLSKYPRRRVFIFSIALFAIAIIVIAISLINARLPSDANQVVELPCNTTVTGIDTSNDLVVRQTPSTSAELSTLVSRDEAVVLLQHQTDIDDVSWYQIRIGDGANARIGWLQERYLTLSTC